MGARMAIRAKRVVIYLMWLVGLLLSPTVWAWNGYGHVLIAQLALDSLPLAQRDDLARQTEPVWQTLPKARQEGLAHKYAGFDHLAMLSVMPDQWRNFSFADWWAVHPDSHTYDLGPSQTWHYTDLPFPRTSTCSYPHGHLSKALATIGGLTWPQATNQIESRARVMQYIWYSHLIGDAWQPLHIVSGVNAKCKIDYGGNKICWRRSKSGKCRVSLHQYWDSGLGEFTNLSQITKLRHKLKLNRSELKAGLLGKHLPGDFAVIIEHAYEVAPAIFGDIGKENGLYDGDLGVDVVHRSVHSAALELARWLDKQVVA